MPLLPLDARLRAENALLRIVADISSDLTDHGAFFDVLAGPWRVVASVAPLDSTPRIAADGRPPPEELTAAEKRCVSALRTMIGETDGRRQGRAIYEFMRQESRRTGRPTLGWSTVTAALANLVAKRVMINPKDKLGYGLNSEDKGGAT